jgi:hypothetical protein
MASSLLNPLEGNADHRRQVVNRYGIEFSSCKRLERRVPSLRALMNDFSLQIPSITLYASSELHARSSKVETSVEDDAGTGKPEESAWWNHCGTRGVRAHSEGFERTSVDLT